MALATKKRKQDEKKKMAPHHNKKWIKRVALSTAALIVVAPHQCSAFSLAVAPTLSRTASTTQSPEAPMLRKTRLEQPPSWTTFQEEVIATSKKYRTDQRAAKKQHRQQKRSRDTRNVTVTTTTVPAAFSRLFFHTQQSIRPLAEMSNMVAQAQIQSQRIRRMVVSFWKKFQDGLQRQDEAMKSLQQEVDALKLNLEQAMHTQTIVGSSTPQDTFQFAWNLAGDAMVDFGLTNTNNGLHFQLVGDEALLADAQINN